MYTKYRFHLYQGFGSKTIEKMLNHFETEMNILHKLSFDDLEAVVGEKNARNIIRTLERDELLEKMVKNYIEVDE